MKSILVLISVILLMSAPAAGAVIGLFDYGFNIDGVVSVPTLGDPVPAGVDISAFDTASGLGTITTSVIGAGDHLFIGYFDHEIDEATNTYFNEVGGVSGAPAAGQSWEIDEPDFVFGDIFSNFSSSTLATGSLLDNSIGAAVPEDVSMAMGWGFSLAAGQTAVITLSLTEIAPASGFYLSQTDPDSAASVYLAGSLDTGATAVPEPGEAIAYIMLVGFLGWSAIRRKTRVPTH